MLKGLTDFLPEIYLTSYDNLEFLIRIVLAAVMGGSIGFERSKRDKGAGIRTHCIVAVSSAVFMILSKYAFLDLVDVAGTRGADSARIAAQVISGISFLGAGIIFKQPRGSVKGLTTAAGIWATASIGLSVGAGLYWLGLMTTIILLSLQFLLHKHRIGDNTMAEQEIKIKMKEDREVVDAFDQMLKERGCIIAESTINRADGNIEIRLSTRMNMPLEYEDTVDFIRNYPQVYRFSV